MKIQGKLVSVRPSTGKDGNQRTFTTKEGTVYECFEVAIDRPTVGVNGKEYNEEIVAEFNRERSDKNIEPYQGYVGTDEVFDIDIYFRRREFNGRFFQDIRLGSVNKKMS